jgi:hypothetical protein
MHEPEHLESPDELIATARIQFDALAAIGVLTQGQAGSILRLLQGDGRTLSPHDRAFRDNILRYLKKEADFVTVFAEMLHIDKHPAPRGPKPHWYTMLRRLSGKRPRILPQPSNRDPSVAPAMPKRRGAETFLLALAPIKTFILPVTVAAGAVLLTPYAEFTRSDTIISAEPRVKRVTMEADVRSVPPDPDTAIYPSSISPFHAGEEPQEAYLNTCYDQFKANREINANGGMKWSQNGGGYYSECLKRLQP